MMSSYLSSLSMSSSRQKFNRWSYSAVRTIIIILAGYMSDWLVSIRLYDRSDSLLSRCNCRMERCPGVATVDDWVEWMRRLSGLLVDGGGGWWNSHLAVDVGMFSLLDWQSTDRHLLTD